MSKWIPVSSGKFPRVLARVPSILIDGGIVYSFEIAYYLFTYFIDITCTNLQNMRYYLYEERLHLRTNLRI